MSEEPLNDLYCFHTSTNVWESIECDNPPPPRSFHKMVASETRVYVFGGCGVEDRLNDLWCFDIESRTWSALHSFELCCGRGGPSISLSEDESTFIVATGYSGKENDDVYVYDIHANEWSVSVESGSEQFRARSVCASTRIGNYFIISGGEVSASDKGHEGAGDFASDLVVLDAKTGRSVHYEFADNVRPDPPRGWTAMASDGSRAFLFGGLSGNDDAPLRLNDLYLLTFKENQ